MSDELLGPNNTPDLPLGVIVAITALIAILAYLVAR